MTNIVIIMLKISQFFFFLLEQLQACSDYWTCGLRKRESLGPDQVTEVNMILVNTILVASCIQGQAYRQGFLSFFQLFEISCHIGKPPQQTLATHYYTKHPANSRREQSSKTPRCPPHHCCALTSSSFLWSRLICCTSLLCSLLSSALSLFFSVINLVSGRHDKF